MEMIAGTATFSINGVTYALVGEFSYRPASPTREMLAGMDGPHGFKAKPGWGQIKGKIRDMGTFTVASIGQMVNVTITCELANGKTVVGRGMFTTEAPSADAEEAEIEVTWEGKDVTESLAA